MSLVKCKVPKWKNKICNNGVIKEFILDESELEEIGVIYLDNVSLGGRGDIIIDIHKNDLLFSSPSLYPLFWQKKMRENNFQCEWKTNRERIYDTNVLMISLPYGMIIYGHVLIEILPKLFYLKYMYPNIMEKNKIALPERVLPNWFYEILNSLFDLTEKDFIFYEETKEFLSFKGAYIPTLLHTNYALHPMINLFVSYVKEKLGIENLLNEKIENIYISRGNLSKQNGPERILINDIEIESFMNSQGFISVYPEQMSFEKQIAVFSQAKNIVGPFGSGLHNALFSNFNTNVVSFRRHTMVQDHIARLRKQNLYHIQPSHEEMDKNGKVFYKIDVEDIELVLNIIREGA